jgi:hypothetical protein
MAENELKLYFEGEQGAELIETHFWRAADSKLHVSVRGKTAGPLKASGSFQWTSAVKALSLLCLKIAVAERSGSKQAADYLIEGLKGSPAASLDYALSKQTEWLREMFGLTGHGTVYARRLILRTNAERKRPGPVFLGLNTLVLQPTNIKIFVRGEEVTACDRLSSLLAQMKESLHEQREGYGEVVHEELAA